MTILLLKDNTLSLFRLSKSLSKIKKLDSFAVPKDFEHSALLKAQMFSEGVVLFDFSSRVCFFHVKRRAFKSVTIPGKPRLIQVCRDTSQLLVVSKYHCVFEYDLSLFQNQSRPRKVLDSFDWKILEVFIDSPKKVQTRYYEWGVRCGGLI